MLLCMVCYVHTYTFISQYLLESGQAPLLSEIAQGIGISSKGVVHRYVSRLAELGYITTGEGRHRGISLVSRHKDASQIPPDLESSRPVPLERRSSLPLLGKIAAGKPIEAIAGQDSIDMMEFFVGPDRFVLRVEGDSMQDAGILDGDMVVVRKAQTARNNEIVVALVDMQDATLKYFCNHGDVLLCSWIRTCFCSRCYDLAVCYFYCQAFLVTLCFYLG